MNQADELPVFLSTLYDGLKGYIYAPTKEGVKFTQEFFSWPSEQSGLIEKILSFRDKGDIYVGPAIYGDVGNATKSGIIGSNTVWVEFDGNYDNVVWGHIPEPTLVIQSSLVGRTHCYWRLDNPVSVIQLERITRALCNYLRADPSCWDATQLLRPPGTLNSKRGVRTCVLVANGRSYPASAFDGLVASCELPDVPIIGGPYPSASLVMSKYQFTERFYRTIIGEIELEGIDRSAVTFHVGHMLAEAGCHDLKEMMGVLLHVDLILGGKFATRPDREARILDIAIKCRELHPLPETKKLILPYTIKDPFEIIESEGNEVEWVWNGLLSVGGSFMISGAPGVGKSQLTLDALAHIATGTSFLGWETKKMKVGFASLEMGETGIKNILKLQFQKWSQKDRPTLKENLVVMPKGEALYLDTKEGQEELEQFIQSYGLQGLAIDSLSATTGEELSNEKVAKRILDYLISLKIKYGIFLWIVHHNRKATSENKKPHSIHDVHGAVAIAARMDTSCTMYTERHKLILDPVKTRMSDRDQDKYELTRGKDLTFQFANQAKGINVKGAVEVVKEQQSTVPKGMMSFGGE